MINRLKRRFLFIGTLFMFILMTVLVLIMNLVNYHEVTADADSVLDMLSRPNLPRFDAEIGPKDRDEMAPFIPMGMSPEVPYESRFFEAMVSADGEVLQSDLSRIVSVDADAAEEYIAKAMNSNAGRGFIGNFRFVKTDNGNGTRIVFLDCGRKLDSFRRFLWISVIVGLGGCVVVFVVFLLTAGKIVAPIAESHEKQKRFISDAGHEIKTPLTIIRANVDLLESDGEKEELTEIREQTERLKKLTNDLILLSKMDEAEQSIRKIEFPLSDLASETVGSFRALALSNGIRLETVITPNLTANGSPDAIRQLISILLDNAVKYSAKDGEITVELTAHRKTALLSVANTTENEIREEDLPHLFDRFYRADASRNSGTGGHGIGLSIAKAIVDAHGGSITAEKKGSLFAIKATLPV